MRTRECDAATRSGRFTKAVQFLDAARTIVDFADEAAEVGDAFVTLCVHAGIAAADVVCCARLGRYAAGEDHGQAVALLRQADPDSTPHLSRLLSVKSKAAYSERPVSAADRQAAERAATALLERARSV